MPAPVWIYIAPHRVAPEADAEWDVLEGHALQTLARALEFQTVVAVVGAGCSCALGVPDWNTLVAKIAKGAPLRKDQARLLRTTRSIESPVRLSLLADLCYRTDEDFRSAVEEALRPQKLNVRSNPYKALLELPIRRFLTTNFEGNLSAALAETGRCSFEEPRVFDQRSPTRIVLLSMALAPGSRYSVFHCHGCLGEKPRKKGDSKYEETMIITESDYKTLYVEGDSGATEFRRNLSLLLQSNPILFVGYGLGDSDFLRSLRELDSGTGRLAGSVPLFALMDFRREDDKEADILKWRGLRERYSVSVISFRRSDSLYSALKRLGRTFSRNRLQWRQQPPVRYLSNKTRLQLLPFGENDPLFFKGAKDDILECVEAALSESRVLALIGEFSSGKYVKLSQFLSRRGRHSAMLFGMDDNRDIYSHLARIAAILETETLSQDNRDRTVVKRIVDALARASEAKKPILLCISGLERLLDVSEGEASNWTPRNQIAKEFVIALSGPKTGHLNIGDSRILLAARRIPEELRCNCLDITVPASIVFTASQLGLNERTWRRLSWLVQGDHMALLLGAAFINSEGDRGKAIQILERTLAASSSERGLRLAKLVIDTLVGTHSRSLKLLLLDLSCTNMPFSSEIFAELAIRHHLRGSTRLLTTLLRHRVLGKVKDGGAKHTGALFVLTPLIKRYCKVRELESSVVEQRSFGLHGYTSRGPFSDPGSGPKPKELFLHFEKTAQQAIRALPGNPSTGDARHARHLTRAAFEVLRCNFSANAVARWGSFADYVRLCAACFDLIKNLALRTGSTWIPGPHSNFYSEHSAITIEEVLWLLNELGLAYYGEGAVQDAISTWGLAIEWQRKLREVDSSQADMYGASLYCHLGAAHLQIGRLATALDYFQRARVLGRNSANADLGARLDGFIARVHHFRGNIDLAGTEYRRVIGILEAENNLRGQSYFMRHLASLNIRLGDILEAKSLAHRAREIAASENYPDHVGYCRELMAKIHRSQKGDARLAVGECELAMEAAKKHGIFRLECDVLLCLAKIQIDVGDASSAERYTYDAFRLANRYVLSLRQIKASMLLGQTAMLTGRREAASNYLRYSRDFAAQCEFRQAEGDAIALLASNFFSGSEEKRSARTSRKKTL